MYIMTKLRIVGRLVICVTHSYYALDVRLAGVWCGGGVSIGKRHYSLRHVPPTVVCTVLILILQYFVYQLIQFCVSTDTFCLSTDTILCIN
jgi:hypothetical protein